MNPSTILRDTAIESTEIARTMRQLAAELLDLARVTTDTAEAKDLEARAIALSRAASASSAVAVAAARALADAVIERLQADQRAREVDPVALMAQLRRVQAGAQGVQ